MKKLFITFMLLMAFAINLNAAKSNGAPHDFVQPDGTTITVRLFGDEHFSYYQTLDGVLLSCVNKAFYVANVTGSGTLESSGVLAHNADARTAEETALAAAQDKAAFFAAGNAALAKATRSISGYPASYFCPHSGTVRVPIILMEYSDSAFYFKEKTVWEEYFNSTEVTPYSSSTYLNGYGSVAQYFRDASDNNLNFVFDIYGPYTANNNHDYYGYSNGKSKSLLTEAVSKADADIDFTKYDSNGDGRVDMVYIVYAGTGRNLSGNNNDFHPACWYTTSSYATVDGMKINIIGGANELSGYMDGTPIRAGIGVTCHEMSHGLGLPDLYWTLSSVPTDDSGNVDYNNCGPEDWDLMDGGENLYNGIWPCQYTAWEREIMGWETVEELTEPKDITIYPHNKGGKAYIVRNPANENEYYTLENLPYDGWNFYQNNIGGCGATSRSGAAIGAANEGKLMIMHLNSNSGTTGFNMKPNNTYAKPNITVVPADGIILGSYSVSNKFLTLYKGELQNVTSAQYYEDLKGDPYPGSQNVTSVAAYNNYSGDDDMVDEYPITGISQNSDGSINLNFGKLPITPNAAGVLSCVAASPLDFSSVSGLKAYVATEVSPSAINLVSVKKVAKGEAFVVKGEHKTYYVPLTSNFTHESGYVNLFCAADGTKKSSDYGSNIYCLNTSGNFQQVANDVVIPEGKAYLKSNTQLSAKLLLRFFDNDNLVTTVTPVKVDSIGVRKSFRNGTLVIETVDGTFNATGVRIK